MVSAMGAAGAGAAAILLNYGKLFNASNALLSPVQTVPQDAKKVFSKCGTCSRAYFTLLNNEFGYPKITEELASDPLAGGLMNTQHQCGMVWGSALAVGAESFRKFKNYKQAMSMAITGTQHITSSFKNRTQSLNCRDVIDVDISGKLEVGKFMLKSLPAGFSNMLCMSLAERWLPEAVESVKEGLTNNQTEIPELPLSCASEVVKKMGGSNEEIVMVSGLAGGIGLSGEACGALGAAIWKSSVDWCKENPNESGSKNPKTHDILEAFKKATESEMLCSNICGQSFNSINEHTDFVKNGGCEKVINILSQI